MPLLFNACLFLLEGEVGLVHGLPALLASGVRFGIPDNWDGCRFGRKRDVCHFLQNF